jgi:catechol 2,3-dioxygenase-like lactoylglutathione lyase family enzyme
MIKGLHHNAYRCRDSEETRKFYEGFLGLPLVATLEIGETKSGRKTQTLHTFYRMDDGSHLAFFEAPDMPVDFKQQHDYDLHIALEVDRRRTRCWTRVEGGFETRGIRPRTSTPSISATPTLCHRADRQALTHAGPPTPNSMTRAAERWQAEKPKRSA